MYKNGLTLCFAVVAALAVFLSALLNDARILTALLRSVLGFLVGGVASYLCLYALERWQIAGFDKKVTPELPPEKEDEGEDSGGIAAEEQEAEDGFQPLEADGFEHLRVPKE